MQLFFLTCFLFGVLFAGGSLLGLVNDLGHLHAHGNDLHFHWSLPAAIAFITWFGAAGYLLSPYIPLALTLGCAIAAGLAVGTIIDAILAKIKAGDRKMDEAEYCLEGKIAQVTVSIPEGGVGEVVLTLAGSRRSEAARSTEGKAVPQGSEVVITEYQEGFALVTPLN
ncbi:MAG: hypothetical protein ACM3YO_08320 [Bacteroidota bacterium]